MFGLSLLKCVYGMGVPTKNVETNAWERKNLLGPTRKCHRQVVDLMRLCLVFGLPLPRLRNVGENDFHEPVPRTARSDDLADVADNVVGPALRGGLHPSRGAA